MLDHQSEASGPKRSIAIATCSERSRTFPSTPTQPSCGSGVYRVRGISEISIPAPHRSRCIDLRPGPGHRANRCLFPRPHGPARASLTVDITEHPLPKRGHKPKRPSIFPILLSSCTTSPPASESRHTLRARDTMSTPATAFFSASQTERRPGRSRIIPSAGKTN